MSPKNASRGACARTICYFPALILFALVPIAGRAKATVVERKSLPDLVKSAEWVFEGRVTKTEAGYDLAGSIATTVTMEATRAMRGVKAQEIVNFMIPGGEIGGRGLLIAGMPKFKAGDEAILFMTVATNRGIRVPVGLGQGKFNIEREAKTGAKLLSRDLDGLETIDTKTGKPVSIGADARWTYDTTVENIEKLVRDDDEARAKAAKSEGAASRGAK